MVLQKQIVQLPFRGLQTKVDPKIAPLGTYAVLDNWVMHKYPELRKREGLQSIGDSTSPTNINASYTYLNEIGVITNNALYSYSPALDQYLLKGQTASPIISAKPMIANTYTQTCCDSSMTSTSILGAVWEDSRGGVRCSVKDVTSDTFLKVDTLLSATGSKPKVVAINNAILFLWCETGTTALKAQQFNTLTNSFASAVVIETAMAASYTYDAIPIVNNVLIGLVSTVAAPGAVEIYYWNIINGAIGSPIAGTPSSASLAFTNSGTVPPTLSLAGDPTGTYFTCTIQNDSKQIYTKSFDIYLNVLTTELLVAAATTDVGWGLSSCVDTSNNTYIFYSTFNTLHNSFYAKVSSNITTPAVASNAAFILQMGVVSKAFYYSGNAYTILGYTSALQNTYFGMRNDGACFGRMFATVGGGNVAKANCMSSFNVRPDKVNTYMAALLKTTKITASNTTYYSTTSVFTEQIFFTPSNIDNKVLGKFLNVAGGYLKQYDGSDTVYEQGFHLAPEVPTNVATKPGGAAIADGTYLYVVVWEWTDNQGQVHRSLPSTPLSVVNSGGPSTNTLTIRCLPLTNKETRFADVRTPVVAAVYRTLTLGISYYRVNQLVSTFVYNDPTAQSITFVDNNTDATISANSLLYTTGNVFANIGLPSTNLLAVGKNRVIVAGTDTEPNRVYFSKEKEEGVAIEFSAELSFLVDSLGGDITALAALDDKIIIYKKSLVYYVAGQGPDKVGNGSFSIPQLVASDCGCIYPQSIVLTGKGLMFQSQKGIYLMDRQLQVTYIGAPLDSITTDVTTTLQITSAVNLPDQNQVMFTDVNNQAFMYDTYFDKWYTHTLPFTPIAATVLSNNWYVSSTTATYKQIPNQAFDSINSAIISRVKTNWISIAELDGFVRIFAILIYGDNANLQHTLKANLYYDFEQFPRESISIVPYNLSTATTYGSDATYGSGSPYGGSFDGAYNFVIRPKVQKCSSIMIELYDEFPDGSRSQSFYFSGISLVVGIKPTWNKGLSYTKRLR